ncbi:hypothetical protein LCGC14_0616910 [marine sediment metagenome]|uniref:Uncharacterized protein n=1 Tax=marine sediment metagenome TaxID=412755 RepID=A0A0F9RAW5_9ZZZZ
MDAVKISTVESGSKKKSRKFLGLIIIFGVLLGSFILSLLVGITPDIMSVFFRSIVFSFAGFVGTNMGITAVAVAVTKDNDIPESVRWGNKFTGLILVTILLLVAMIVFRLVGGLGWVTLLENQADYYTSICRYTVYGYLAYVGGNAGITISAIATNKLGV